METEQRQYLDARSETLTVACAICRRPKSACRPDSAGPPVCRPCALGVLPRLIAQAVLADPGASSRCTTPWRRSPTS